MRWLTKGRNGPSEPLLSQKSLSILELLLIQCRGEEFTDPKTLIDKSSNNDADRLHNSYQGNISCIPPPLNAQSWEQLKVDQFIGKYPNSSKISVKEFAAQNGAQNFLCGIGEHCNAGPLCTPIKSVDAWLVAYSIQEWSHYMNQLYNAVGYMGSSISAISSSLLSELMIDSGKPRIIHAVETLTSHIGMFTIISVLFGFTVLSAFIPWGRLQIGVLFALGVSLPFRASLTKPHGKEEGFSTWSDFGYYITQAQQIAQATISNQTKKVLSSGLNDSQDGIFNSIRGGYFLELHPNQQSQMELMMARMLKAKIISKILRLNNAYIIRRGDPCKYNGPHGARDGSGVLSYCDPQGILWDIVKAHGKHTLHTIYNGHIIQYKYNFTTEEIVMTSWACQSKYKKFEYEILSQDEIKNGTVNLTQNRDWIRNMGDCSFNLPVCDCDIPEIHLARATTRKTTTQICRNIGNLPI